LSSLLIDGDSKAISSTLQLGNRRKLNPQS